MTSHDVDAQVEAVLDVLAPKITLPNGWTFAPGVLEMRVPIILIDYEGLVVRPGDEQMHALAERIVTAIRTASSARKAADREAARHPAGGPS